MKYAIADGLVSIEDIYTLEMVELSKQFGWTPEQIRNMDVEDLQNYRAVLSGWKKRGISEEV